MVVPRLAWHLCILGFAVFGFCLDVPTVKIDGVQGKVDMPLVGIGTWQYNDTRAGHAVELAFSLGYRHVDTAWIYKNQVGVGKALKSAMHKLSRKEFFVTSKIPGGFNASASKEALDKCLQDLGLEYVDLMLLHFPFDLKGKGSPAMRKEQWATLEKWALSGKARAIGISHYCRHHVEDILSISKVPIAVNQVQYHVGMGTAPDTATDDKAWIQKQGILYQSFSPLCGPCTPPHNTELRTGPLVTGVGKKYGKTGPQIALKWLVQQGIPVIPKSDKAEHLKENMDLFDFELSEADMKALTEARSPPVAGGPSDTDSGDCEAKEYDAFVV